MRIEIESTTDEPYFDRFDVAEAYYVLRMAGHLDGTDGRLERIRFTPRARLSGARTTADAFFTLNDNARAIFARYARRTR